MSHFPLQHAIDAIHCKDLDRFKGSIERSVALNQSIKITSLMSYVSRDLLLLLASKPELVDSQNHFHLQAWNYLAQLKEAYPEAYGAAVIDWSVVNGVIVKCLQNESIKFNHIGYPIELMRRTYPDYDIDATNFGGGVSMLMAAVNNGAVSAKEVKSLIDLGADVNGLSEQNGRAIHCLNLDSQHVAIEKLRVLLSVDADPLELTQYIHLNPLGIKSVTYSSFIHYLELNKSLKGAVPAYVELIDDMLTLIKQNENAKTAMHEIEKPSAKRVKAAL